jgi:hypothetical protein
LDDDQQSWCGARGHRDARLRKLAWDSARYRVCLDAAARDALDGRLIVADSVVRAEQMVDLKRHGSTRSRSAASSTLLTILSCPVV